MPFRYSPEVRRTLCERMLKGERVETLSAESGISGVTLYRWKRQALVDADRAPGVKSHEVDELAKAQRRIHQLEMELEMVKAATAIFNGEEVVRPKGSARS
jgi:transposase-like protein